MEWGGLQCGCWLMQVAVVQQLCPCTRHPTMSTDVHVIVHLVSAIISGPGCPVPQSKVVHVQ
jgi:hypothetical protein